MTPISGGSRIQLTYLHIRNFEPIRDLEVRSIDRALILVGKSNTGRISVLDAVCAVRGCYQIQGQDFNEKRQAIHINAVFSIEERDLEQFHRRGVVSQYRRYDVWKWVFRERLPSFQDGELCFISHVSLDGRVRYEDLYRENNPYIPMVLPHIYRITTERELNQLQDDLSMFQEDKGSRRLRPETYIFEEAKKCNRCFQYIGLINKKKPKGLTVFETTCLLEYEVYQLNPSEFSKEVNENFYKNGGYEGIQYTLSCDTDQLFPVEVTAHNFQRGSVRLVELMGRGMRSIYMLSLLEIYISEQSCTPGIIVVEGPEIFFHPQLQKTCNGILYRLSKKNQVILKAHSSGLLFNFGIHQIRQVMLDEEWYSVIKKEVDLGEILDDLGYGTSNLLNVSFMFIAERKQDKSRLPLLLEKYYSEIYDSEGKFSRVSIITTNSCTDIKAHANLKYMNQMYSRDQSLMIRDGDDKDPGELVSQLCKYYDEHSLENVDRLPKVTRRNVLILKYYSFENCSLSPSIMAKLGIVGSEETFYKTLCDKWREYLYRIRSGQQLKGIMGRDLTSCQDMGEYTEEVKTYMRDHSLCGMFYEPSRGREQEILRAYIDMAPSEEFKGILEAVNGFVYFDNHKREDVIADK